MEAWTTGLLPHREGSENLARAAEILGEPPKDELSYLSEPSSTLRKRDQRIRKILEQRCEKFRIVRKIRVDPLRSEFILVMIPEQLPILESLKKHKIRVSALIVNRILPDEVTDTFMQQRRVQEAHYLEEILRVFKSFQQYRIPLSRMMSLEEKRSSNSGNCF